MAPSAQRLMTQPTKNLTKTPSAQLMPPPANKLASALMRQKQPQDKSVSTGAALPPKKLRSAHQSNESKKLNNELNDINSFPESANSQGAAGGGLQVTQQPAR